MTNTLALTIHPSVLPQVAERLLMVLEIIEKNPERYDQHHFGRPGTDFDFDKREIRCKSACCVAGHIVATFGNSSTTPLLFAGKVGEEAMRLLGVPEDTRAEFSSLFDLPLQWPQNMRRINSSWNVDVTSAHLRQRIEHYIATGSMWP